MQRSWPVEPLARKYQADLGWSNPCASSPDQVKNAERPRQGLNYASKLRVPLSGSSFSTEKALEQLGSMKTLGQERAHRVKQAHLGRLSAARGVLCFFFLLNVPRGFHGKLREKACCKQCVNPHVSPTLHEHFGNMGLFKGAQELRKCNQENS